MENRYIPPLTEAGRRGMTHTAQIHYRTTTNGKAHLKLSVRSAPSEMDLALKLECNSKETTEK
jgi:hypothetical protein